MVTSTSALHASLAAHNDTFETLLRLIPAKYYLVQEQDDADGQGASKYHINKRKQAAPKQAIKEATKRAKRERLDPANNKSVLELQAEKSAKSKGKQKADDSDATDSDADSDDVDMVVDGDLGGDSADEGAVEEDEDAEVVPMPAGESIAELRGKLHAKIARLQGRGRGAPAGRDELLEERRAQRAAMRERRRKETKEKIRAQKEKKGKGKGDKAGAEQAKGPTNKTQLLVPDFASGSQPPAGMTHVAYGALAGEPSAATAKKAARLKVASNPTQALAQIQHKKERLAALPADKRERALERDAWATAEARMEGVKVRDDEARLKKAVKRGEKTKLKSKKEWDDRKEQLANNMAAKQKKRTDNIAARNERRSDKKKGIKPKSAKARPGFEGKSFGKGKGGGGKGKGK